MVAFKEKKITKSCTFLFKNKLNVIWNAKLWYANKVCAHLDEQSVLK